MVATAAHTARALTARHYDVAFNFGVCGSFDPALALGTVVHVTTDRLSELGAEDGDHFVPFEVLGLDGTTVIVNDAAPDNAALRELPSVTGITVNTVHGHEPTIAAVQRSPSASSGKHGGCGVCLRLFIEWRAIRAGPRRLERYRASQSRGLANGPRHSQPQRRCACASSSAHEALTRLLAVPQ